MRDGRVVAESAVADIDRPRVVRAAAQGQGQALCAGRPTPFADHHRLYRPSALQNPFNQTESLRLIGLDIPVAGSAGQNLLHRHL